MRIVLDTNVLSRAAAPHNGPARAVLLLITDDPHVLLFSPYLVSELNRVLRYERVRRIHGLDDAGIDGYIATLQSAGVTVILSVISPPSVPRDPDDNPIVATAVAGNADVLCTRDAHLHDAAVKSYCSVRGIRVLTDLKLLPELRAARQSP